MKPRRAWLVKTAPGYMRTWIVGWVGFIFFVSAWPNARLDCQSGAVLDQTCSLRQYSCFAPTRYYERARFRVAAAKGSGFAPDLVETGHGHIFRNGTEIARHSLS